MSRTTNLTMRQFSHFSKRIALAVALIILVGGFFGVPKSHAAYLNITGFETGDKSESPNASANSTIQSSVKRTGNYALELNPSAASSYFEMRAIAANGTPTSINRTAATYYAVYVRFASFPTTQMQIINVTNNESQTVGLASVDSAGQLRGEGATSSSVVATLSLNTWYLLEMKVVSNATSEVRLNGGTVQTFTANNLAQTEFMVGNALSGGTYHAYYDDVAISDSAYPGAGQVNILKPNAAGSYAGWDTGTSAQYVVVNEVPHNGDTNYIQPGASSNTSSFNVDDSSTAGISGSIKTVKSIAIGRNTNGSDQGKVAAFSNGNAISNVAPTYSTWTTSYAGYAAIGDVDPSTGAAWTSGGLDSIQVGCQSNGGSLTQRCTAVYAMVWSTPSPAPTTVGTAANGTPQSYYVTLNGSANPNGYSTLGHFRVYTTNPGNCNADSGGTRYPEGAGNFPDINLGSGTSVVSAPTFSYTIPFNASSFLTPNTTYYYCAYAVNTVNSTNYTTGGSGVVSFTTPDGPASPCDAPSTGNLTIPSGADCNFNGMLNGVDSGSGSRNTALLSIPAGSKVTIAAGQKIAFGSVSLARGATLSIARGGSLSGGPIFVHDNDRDNYLDNATQYVGSTASAATEFIRRNAISSIYNYAWKIASSGATYDCNNTNANVFNNIFNLVTDQDNDGYKTAATASTQCVGANSLVNGRIYLKNASGNYLWLDNASALGGGTTDCQDDPNGAPCAPTSLSATAGSTTQINLSWSNPSGGAVPAISSFDVYKCGLNNSSCTAPPAPTNVSNSTFALSDTSLTCSTSPSYYYKVVAKNGNGNSSSSIFSGVTSTCCTNMTVYTDTDGDHHGRVGGTITRGDVRYTAGASLNMPAGVENGTVLVAGVYGGGGSTPTGWTLVNTRQLYGNGTDLSLFYRVAQGTETSAVNFGGSRGIIAAYNGVKATSPVIGSGTAGDDGWGKRVIHTPTVFVNVSNTMSVMWSTSPWSANIETMPSSYTKVYANGDTMLADRTQTSIGWTPYQSIVMDQNLGSGGSTMLILQPDDAASTTMQCVTGGVATGQWSIDQTDCNDNSPNLYQVLSGYKDRDGDTRVSSTPYSICSGAALPTGYVSSPSGNDCDDGDAFYYQVLTGYADFDGDGYTAGATPVNLCSGATLPSHYLASASGTADCYDLNSYAYPNESYAYPQNRGTYVYCNPDGYGGCYSYSGATWGNIPDSEGHTGNSYDFDCNNSEEKSISYFYTYYTCTNLFLLHPFSLAGCEPPYNICTSTTSQIPACGEIYAMPIEYSPPFPPPIQDSPSCGGNGSYILPMYSLGNIPCK